MHTDMAAAAAVRPNPCRHCGHSLSGKRPDARYCSDTCSKRSRRGSASEARKARTSPPPPREASRTPVRAPSASGGLTGLLAELADQPPGWIASAYTGRTFPRTYAEHGRALPEYLKVLGG